MNKYLVVTISIVIVLTLAFLTLWIPFKEIIVGTKLSTSPSYTAT